MKYRCRNCCKHFWNKVLPKSITWSADETVLECDNCGHEQNAVGWDAIKFDVMYY